MSIERELQPRTHFEIVQLLRNKKTHARPLAFRAPSGVASCSACISWMRRRKFRASPMKLSTVELGRVSSERRKARAL